MVRKQLYITEEQERALKERARVEGVAEAEIVRYALDRHLRGAGGGVLRSRREQALQDVLDGNKRLAASLDPATGPFRREDLYAERESRWLRNEKE